jgi:hypothetical protein
MKPVRHHCSHRDAARRGRGRYCTHQRSPTRGKSPTKSSSHWKKTEAPSSKPGGTFVFGNDCRCMKAKKSTKGSALFSARPKATPAKTPSRSRDTAALSCFVKSCAARWRQGARMAEPGEFTKRAFPQRKNGSWCRPRPSPTSSTPEAIAPLMPRSSSWRGGSVKSSTRSMSRLGRRIAADLETTLDFARRGTARRGCSQLSEKNWTSVSRCLETLLATWDEGRLLREGARVVIMGRPNAGQIHAL